MVEELESRLKPYKGTVPTYTRLPEVGRSRTEILKEMEELASLERARWQRGFASGAVYHGDEEYIDFLCRAYAINSQSNPLHADLWPSTVKYEAEIVSMTANMLGAGAVGDGGDAVEICGTVTSGGTESILLAMKTYRDWARARKGIMAPEMVVPSSAHAAFDKAAQYFNISIVRVPVGPDFRADVAAMREAVTKNTIVIVGSAPSFPHGVIDPIEELSELAREKGSGFHVDACLGGFLLPWAERLGYEVPPFDFRLRGVTSISVDTHKYGYAPKGTSVILYRGRELRRYQYFKVTDWSGGLYVSPTIAGSRPGGLIASCWAAMVSMGESGYLEAARKILLAAEEIKAGIASIPELYILGKPLWNIAFASDTVDIYRVMDFMSGRGWSLNPLQKPPSVHICVTLRHAQKGVMGRFMEDLRAAVEHVKSNPQQEGGMAPIYGMAATVPDRKVVAELLDGYLDTLYSV